MIPLKKMDDSLKTDTDMPALKYIVESLFFVSDKPLDMDQLKKALPETDPALIRQAIGELRAEYGERGGGFYLRNVAGGYQLRTRPEFAPWLRKLRETKPVQLSMAAKEALVIIAYNQPALRSYVEHIRGVDSGGVIKLLLEKNLIRVLGRDDKPGRPMLYGTTKRFLEVFDLKDLSELPTLKEIQELGSSDKEESGDLTQEKKLAEENNTVKTVNQENQGVISEENNDDPDQVRINESLEPTGPDDTDKKETMEKSFTQKN